MKATIALIDINKVIRLLTDYIDPFEIPGAMDAVMESLIELEYVKEEHNDTQISGE